MQSESARGLDLTMVQRTTAAALGTPAGSSAAIDRRPIFPNRLDGAFRSPVLEGERSFDA